MHTDSTVFYDLSDQWTMMRCLGADTRSFLQNITPNDLLTLENGQGHHNAILDKKSNILCDFWLYCLTESEWAILTEQSQEQAVTQAVDSYHFSEEFDMQTRQATILLVHGKEAMDCLKTVFPNMPSSPALNSVSLVDYEDSKILVFQRTFSGYPSYIIVSENHPDPFIQTQLAQSGAMQSDTAAYDMMRLEAGIPIYGLDFDSDIKLLELNRPDEMISFTKGCYPGQEIVARTRRRGTPRRLLLGLEIEQNVSLDRASTILFDSKDCGLCMSNTWSTRLNKTIALAYINKTLQLEDGLVDLMIGDTAVKARIVTPPFYFPEALREEAVQSYKNGMQAFHDNKFEQAIDFFRHAITLDPHYVDAYEALGVSLERMERYDEALRHNRRFAEMAPNAVMARANLSRLYMLKGMKAEAEEEQAKAAALAMRLQARSSGQTEHDQKAVAQAEQSRRESIFRQVLEMDPDDEVANFGLGKLHAERKEYQEAVEHLKKVVTSNPSYSAAYPLLARAMMASGNVDEARARLEQGIAEATRQGDLMPAKEMQELLKDLAQG
jgi:folate-binding protein YgfZ